MLENLQREHEKAKLSRFQRVSFTLLQIAVYAIPLALLFLWLIYGTGSRARRSARRPATWCCSFSSSRPSRF